MSAYGNSVIDLRNKYSVRELRHILKKYLDIDSVLPSFIGNSTGNSAHCILKIKPLEGKDIKPVKWKDQVTCRLFRKLSREQTQTVNKDDINFSTTKVNYKI